MSTGDVSEVVQLESQLMEARVINQRLEMQLAAAMREGATGTPRAPANTPATALTVRL
jgi:hypothetical protein